MPKDIAYTTTVQDPPSPFFQQAIIVQGIFVGVVFANINCIQRFNKELNTVTSAGCYGTFKTVTITAKQFREGTFMTF